jgi:hypothetical protein
MIRDNHYLKSQRGQVLPEQAFILTAIVGIALLVVLRIGFETGSMFDKLSMTFPRFSNGGSGRKPARNRPKGAGSSPTAMAANDRPAPTAGSRAAKAPGAGPRRASGGGGLSQSKRDRDTKDGAPSTSSTGSGVLTVLIGR